MIRLRRILHPTDFTRASTAAFKRAVARAKADRAQLLIAHVLSPAVPMAGEGYISPKVYDEIESSSRKYAQKRLVALQAKARAAGVKTVTLLLDGVADQQIVRAARLKKADLIIMGTHGRSGLAKFFLGSVTSRVVATASCPVLTVRGK